MDTTPTIAARAGNWHRQPRARAAILACVAANERLTYERSDWHRDAQPFVSGPLGEQVEAIRSAFGAAALAHFDETGDRTFADAWCAAPDAAHAIEAAFQEAAAAKGAVA